ncbi:hypothetical protein BFF78_42160 [Streptomyces fodineus]|uniref:PPM-type phosphatase domain-containing protein n=2 Tax=Streptomyces fodineus TaxID=1904616 RepID=A0A1D7Y2J2_9ACTN|nr:hypothetical protein BFF78_00465 [Streptomyces fodineus]AOR36773.1 hypothetical protein BFF78_42160 [Streptomyces fodineus]
MPDLPTGPPLGTAEGPPFAATTISVADGSVLAFYTASLLRTSPSPDTLQRVLAHLERPLQDLCDDVLYRLRKRRPLRHPACPVAARPLAQNCGVRYTLDGKTV